MSIKNSLKNSMPLARIMGSNPQMLRVKPSVLWFLNNYMSRFQVRKIGNNLILHSHLPPLNSHAYSRFVKEHLLTKVQGPTHAQIGLTNACPQRCEYCYNRTRKGQVMDTETIKRTARELIEMGVVWLGLTGGEPLLNPDIADIIESVSDDCAVKLFTTGCTLTRQKAMDLKQAGLFSVSVSLDHWQAQKHDQGRRYPGAFQQALKAIEIFKSAGGIQVGVSAVLSREMIRNGEAEYFLEYLKGLGIDEAWLSEVKPSLASFWDDKLVITDDDRLKLVKLQDRYNSSGAMTVNYLGHFEGKECFGCNAGNKMVYVDAFGEVSPCVFTPLSFGNVQSESLASIYKEMKMHFPSEDGCFINKNYRLLQRYAAHQEILGKQDTLNMLKEVHFGKLAKFNKIYYGDAAYQNAFEDEWLRPRIGESV